MDIQVGDRVTYIDHADNETIKSLIVGYDWQLPRTKADTIEILKIERPKYEVIEEKKELLTEEEKEFLKQLIKYSTFNIKYIKKPLNDYLDFLDNKQDCCFDYNFIDNMFNELVQDKVYTLEELELEKNN